MNTNKKLDNVGLERLVENVNKEINKKVNAIKDFGYSKEEIDTKVAPIGEEYIRNLFSKEGDPSDPVPKEYYTKEESDAKYVNKSELGEVANTKYTTVNGVKEFDVACDGYVDNVVIEGETLVNKTIETPSTWQSDNKRLVKISTTHTLVSGTEEFTAINTSNKDISINFLIPPSTWLSEIAVRANSTCKFTLPTGSQLGVISGYGAQGWTQTDNLLFDKSLVILSGNHVGKQIPYFKGIASIGQGDKIEVLSIQNNKINKIDLSSSTWLDNKHLKYTNIEELINGYSYTSNYIPLTFKTGESLIIEKGNPNMCFYDENKNYIPHNLPYFTSDVEYSIAPIPLKAKYFRITVPTSNKNLVTAYVSKQDKKQILTTLRSLPSGVKDKVYKIGDKYYKYEKCAERLLKTTDFTSITTSISGSITRCILRNNNLNSVKSATKVFCNRFTSYAQWELESEEVYSTYNENQCSIVVKVLTANLNGKTVESFIDSSNITVVYELEQPRLIELPNFNPRTFKGKSTIVVNSGAIQCEAQYEVTNNLRSEVDVLKDKVDSAFQSGSSTKQNLADKLTSVGVPNVSASNTFAELIASIPMKGTDVKIATGEIVLTDVKTKQFNTVASSELYNRNYIELNLGFKPNHIIIMPKANSYACSFLHDTPYRYQESQSTAQPLGEPWVYCANDTTGVSGDSNITYLRANERVYVSDTTVHIPVVNAPTGGVFYYTAIKYK